MWRASNAITNTIVTKNPRGDEEDVVASGDLVEFVDVGAVGAVAGAVVVIGDVVASGDLLEFVDVGAVGAVAGAAVELVVVGSIGSTLKFVVQKSLSLCFAISSKAPASSATGLPTTPSNKTSCVTSS